MRIENDTWAITPSVRYTALFVAASTGIGNAKSPTRWPATRYRALRTKYFDSSLRRVVGGTRSRLRDQA